MDITIFRPFASRIIHEMNISTGVIRKLILQVINVEILQHIRVVEYFGCDRCGICIRNYQAMGVV